tara:strand:- start:307 stop:1068 length:762 start_codon:yes stop_codon:yes gene_type:complete
MSYCILNFGDSQGELLDYIFSSYSNYINYDDDNDIGWKSGWSTRSLRDIKLLESIHNSIKKYSKMYNHLYIFLSFGCTDIEWNLGYKRLNQPNIDTINFVDEMVDGLKGLIELLSIYDCVTIIPIFAYFPLPLKEDYLKRYNPKYNLSIYYDIPSLKERIELWNIFKTKIHNNYKCIDLDKYYKENGIEYFLRDYEDHHPDFVKLQYFLCKELKEFNFNVKPEILEHYPHVRRIRKCSYQESNLDCGIQSPEC